jgi:hypothetical protein
MTVHHLISEADQRHSCPYCGKSVAALHWKSLFDFDNSHYKEFNCSCGRRMTIKVGFVGSGHDSWNSIEKKIMEADAQSRKE